MEAMRSFQHTEFFLFSTLEMAADSLTTAAESVVCILEEPRTSRFMAVRSNGACEWVSEGNTVFREASRAETKVRSAAWCPRATRRAVLALGCENRLVLVDAKDDGLSGALERCIRTPAFTSDNVCWSSDGRYLFASSRRDSAVRIFDAALGVQTESRQVVGFRNGVNSMHLSNNHLVLSGSVLPVLKCFNLSLDEATSWTCTNPVVVGNLTKDSSGILCGNRADGVFLVSLERNLQWQVLTREQLVEASISCDAQGADIDALELEPVENSVLLVSFSGGGAALFSFTRLSLNLIVTDFIRALDLTGQTKLSFSKFSTKVARRLAVASIESSQCKVVKV